VDISELRARNPEHWKTAAALRVLAMDAVQAANSGHPGMPMGMADVATVLYRDHLKFDAANPEWPDRDRFVLSAGHGSMLLYGLLHLTWSRSATSASSATKPPGTPNMATRRALR
jgi:transketolase